MAENYEELLPNDVQSIELRQCLVINNSKINRGSSRDFGPEGSSFVDYSIYQSRNVAQRPFVSFQKEFLEYVLGEEPFIRILATMPGDQPLAHEAGIWFPDRREVFFSSNQLHNKDIKISKINIDTGDLELAQPSPPIPHANGGCVFNGGALFASQGDSKNPAGLILMDPKSYHTGIVTNNFFDKPYNSPNDVVVFPLDNSIWFTDPDYGVEQGLKDSEKAMTPNQVYCLNPDTGAIRVVADGFVKPNGICFSHDSQFCYISDTGAYLPQGGVDKRAPATIYEYQVQSRLTNSGAVYILSNRRVFAFTDSGAPDGIKCDPSGNIYGGCSDGLHIWNPAGCLIGKILIPGGVANFCFTDPGRIIMLNETRIFDVKLTGLAFHGGFWAKIHPLKLWKSLIDDR